MKLKLLIVALFMLATTSWPVHAFTIDDDDLIAIPKTAETKIRQAEAGDSDLQKCEFVGRAVDLDGDGQATDWIVTMRDAVEEDMPTGPIWVLRDVKGTLVIVLSDGGHSLTVGDKKHRGLYDLTISAESAGWSRQSTWRFDGKCYRKAREKMKKTAEGRRGKE